MEKKITTIILGFMFVSFGLSAAIRAEDPNLGTVFSYQGRLETAGSEPLNGSYDFQFQVYDTLVGTNTQIGVEMEEPNVPVTEGIFTVQLNPDPNGMVQNLFNGEVRYLEIAVRKTGSAEQYYTISPRQRINAAPYAITASSARWLRGRNSTEKVVYVDDAGNVGIGTTNPTAKLEVNGNFRTTGVYEDVSGDVGIGTMEPGAKLEVAGAAKITGGLKADYDSGWFLKNDSERETWTGEHNLGVYPSRLQIWFSPDNPPSGWIYPVYKFSYNGTYGWHSPEIRFNTTKVELKTGAGILYLWLNHVTSVWEVFNSGYFRILLWK
jgi:hypothetical protein